LKNLFVACGMNTVGVMTGGGVGKVMAEWIATHQRPPGLGAYDVTRAPAFQIARDFRHDRTIEALGVLYALGWPNREYASARGARRSPLHQWHLEKRAVMGERAGWEVPLVYAPPGATAELRYSYGRQDWQEWASEECRQALEKTALFDLSAAAKLEISQAQDKWCMGDLPSPSVCTALGRTIWLTPQGTIEAVVTMLPMENGKCLIFSAPGSERRHLQWMRKQAHTHRSVSITEVTAGIAIFLLAGPGSARTLEECTRSNLSPTAATRLHIGYAPCLAVRSDQYGVEAWLIVTSTEFAAHAVETLERSAGSLTAAGHYALEALRIRAGVPTWPQDLDDLISPDAFSGAGKTPPPRTRLVRLSMISNQVPLYGSEGILCNGKNVGQTTSGHWGPFTGIPEALGFISNDDGVSQSWIESSRFELDAPGGPYPAKCELLPPVEFGTRVAAIRSANP
jgi:4-methylaminobutanoate oxidase (formaldehyde-forming)